MTWLRDSNTHLNKSEQELASPKERLVMCLINNWDELAKVEDSKTHRIEVEPVECCGWIINKATGEMEYYLSTHTFYGNQYKLSNRALQKYGFNVEVRNIDA